MMPTCIHLGRRVELSGGGVLQRDGLDVFGCTQGQFGGAVTVSDCGRCPLFRPCTAEPALPPVLVQAALFSAAVVQHTLAGRPECDAAEQARRMAVCQVCPTGQYRASDQRCARCGCCCALKAAWQEQRCPDGHW